ncbi:glutathione S-transferase protein-like protein [Phyllosticta capitalensis]|uniref:Glutathione S-transferase protein-like protein n=1 Tax=Phyllosticta capitalensis TaxID=121624 RepID=A0ABR1Z2Q0_9PEZI
MSAAASPPSKRARTAENTQDTTYELLYHPTIPGRGEYIRLIFEASSVPYTDVSNSTKNDVYWALSTTPTQSHPPIFALPALRVSFPQNDPLVISQTPSIVEYVAHAVGLAPGPPLSAANLLARQLLLTALDLSNETHDTHHPIAVMMYYEEQKAEAARRAADFRGSRLPKFLAHLEAALEWNKEDVEGRRGGGRYLVGHGLSYADLVWWQVLDGLLYAFPNELAARKSDYPHIFDTFYPGIKNDEGAVSAYVKSDRRLPYSDGLYRRYPELDREAAA